jgi:hypothetical protein
VTSVNIIVVYKKAWRIIFELYEHINYFSIVQIYKLFLGISYVFLMFYVHCEQALSAYMSTFLYLQPRLTQFFFFFLANQTSFKDVFLLTAFFIDDPFFDIHYRTKVKQLQKRKGKNSICYI